MKIRSVHAIPVVLAITASAANAEAPQFSEVDEDGDGKLGIEEATAALPDLEITDANGDGLVNHTEIKQAVEGLSLPAQSSSEEEAVATIGRQEYQMIVQAMEANGQRDV